MTHLHQLYLREWPPATIVATSQLHMQSHRSSGLFPSRTVISLRAKLTSFTRRSLPRWLLDQFTCPSCSYTLLDFLFSPQSSLVAGHHLRYSDGPSSRSSGLSYAGFWPLSFRIISANGVLMPDLACKRDATKARRPSTACQAPACQAPA